MKIKKNDTVIVKSGKDKGKKGKVLKALPRDFKVVVEGVNVRKVHEKNRKDGMGQIVEKLAPIHVSNVMIVDPKDNKPSRVGFKVEGGKKVRIARKSGKEV